MDKTILKNLEYFYRRAVKDEVKKGEIPKTCYDCRLKYLFSIDISLKD
jgi:hypothetical protein